jgi:hypothetical protein
MKRNFWIGLSIGLIVGTLIFSIGATALARSNVDAPHGGGGFSIDWWTVDGGGVMDSTSANFSLNGTIGQPDAGRAASPFYVLVGGFWGSAAVNYNVYLPLILKNS